MTQNITRDKYKCTRYKRLKRWDITSAIQISVFMLCFIIRHGDIQYTVKAERVLFTIVPRAAFAGRIVKLRVYSASQILCKSAR